MFKTVLFFCFLEKEIKELMDELFDACCQGDDLFSPDEVDATLTGQPEVESAKAKPVNNPNKDQQSDDQTNSETNDDDSAQNFVYPGHMPPLKFVYSYTWILQDDLNKLFFDYQIYYIDGSSKDDDKVYK